MPLEIPPLDASQHSRLGFVRTLFLRGVESAERPDPLCALCFLDLHDAAEMFVRVVCDVHHVPVTSRTSLLEYWELVKKKTGEDLGFKVAMVNLNSLRNSLKHSAITPARRECDAAVSVTREFLRENSVRFLGLEFESISIVDLVQWPQTREFLREALLHQAAADLPGAVDFTALAFSVLLVEYQERVRETYGDHHGSLRSGVRSSSMYALGHPIQMVLQEFERQISTLHGGFRLLSLGVDHSRYEHFRLLAPQVTRQWDGKGTLVLDRIDSRPELSLPDSQFCVDFVLSTALRLQELASGLGLNPGAGASELPPVRRGWRPADVPDEGV